MDRFAWLIALKMFNNVGFTLTNTDNIVILLRFNNVYAEKKFYDTINLFSFFPVFAHVLKIYFTRIKFSRSQMRENWYFRTANS